jgi:hypothetical protein
MCRWELFALKNNNKRNILKLPIPACFIYTSKYIPHIIIRSSGLQRYLGKLHSKCMKEAKWQTNWNLH